MFNVEQEAFTQLRTLYAERTTQVVFWTGAGLSAPAGMPTWNALRRGLEEVGERKAETLSEPARSELKRRIGETRHAPDPWTAFERLRRALGEATYVNSVRERLNAKEGVDISIYKLLWRLQIGGVLNLNIDRLASRAFADVRQSAVVHEIAGHEVGDKLHLLKRPQPFIVNLHGQVESSKSWILTRSELDALLARPEYEAFVDAVFVGRTVVFVGVSADDVAAGGLLERLRRKGADPGVHFWITDRSDAATDAWAEANGLLVIRYSGADNHAELAEIIKLMMSYVSADDAPHPVVPPTTPGMGPLPEPDVLAGLPPESIRGTLNAHASMILRRNDGQQLKDYDDFVHRYRRAIYNAWYVSEDVGENIFFGYRLLRKVGEGAFGHIWEAEDEQHGTVAVKLLRQEVMGDDAMIGSFRRGVRSMRLLSEAKIEGMVAYRQAFELPACAIMDFIEGPNLEVAVRTRRLTDWSDKLSVARQIVSIIRRGHLLPQRVLHRDIRPQNIMLKQSWDEPGRLEVVVLDFDLSWHKDATEKSVLLAVTSALGYCAPEQLQSGGRTSTRTALVDSFGLGMTFYFLFTGKHPNPGDSRLPEWDSKLLDDVGALSMLYMALVARTIGSSNRAGDAV